MIYTYNPKLEETYEAEAENIREFAEEIKIVAKSVAEPIANSDQVWKARFTISYSDGIADYIYDNQQGTRFRAPAGKILPVLIKYGDVAILEGPGKLIRREKVIEELKRQLNELKKRKRRDKELLARLTRAIEYLSGSPP
jgi:hypothetical protein